MSEIELHRRSNSFNIFMVYITMETYQQMTEFIL
jgi:hypothetical protein